jgi:glycosyltransferase involved in cell wall biosynthesis
MITLAYVHLNRKEELIRNINHHFQYVDRIVVSDGDSSDGSLEWLASEDARQKKVEYVVKKQYRLPYGNHTPDARNPYLQMLRPGRDDWLIVLDTDEFLEEEACQKLRHFSSRADRAGFDEVRFQARDIWTYETGEMTDNLAEYWKQDMFVKVVPNMSYTGHTHSGLYRPGAKGKWAKAQGQGGRFLHYRHEKTERNMWKNSTFLYWTTCGTAQNRTDSPDWLQFHDIMSRHGYEDWHEFHKAMIAGNLPKEITDWFVAHRNDENPEVCAYWIYYYLWLYPEENVEKLNCERHSRYTWDYVIRAREKKNA